LKSSSGTKRKYLKSKEIRQLAKETYERLGTEIGSEKVEEESPSENAKLFRVEDRPLFIRIGEMLLPTLTNQEDLDRLPSVVVDMGAVPYICGGADVMAPGIRQVKGEFTASSLVVIRDERHGKALSVGVSLMKSEDMRSTKKGKAVKNVHYVGDKLWEIYK